MAKDRVKTKATTTARKVVKTIAKRSHIVRTKPRFYRPKTTHQRRVPQVLRSISTYTGRNDKEDPYNILIQPLSSDKNLAKLENENTIVYLVHPRANKIQIGNAFSKLHDGAKVRSVNTMIRPDAKKKAYIRLSPESDALKIANKLGLV